MSTTTSTEGPSRPSARRLQVGAHNAGDVPSLWGSTPLWLAGALIALEVLSWVFDTWTDVAGIPLAPLALVGVPVAVALSRHRLKDATLAVCLVSFTVAAAVSVPWTGLGRVAALAASAGAEEAVFRLAIPVLVIAGLRRLRVSDGLAMVAAVTLASGIFCVMPGHVAQWAGSPLGPLPWVCMSLLWCWMLWRGAPLLATVALHASFNLVASTVSAGGPQRWWLYANSASVAGVVAAEMWRDHRALRERRSGEPAEATGAVPADA